MLTEKQKRFCDYYIELGNATQAAIQAGYSKKTATVVGCQNLAKPNIKANIDQRLKALKDARIADAAEVLEYLTGVMRGESEASVLASVGDGCQQIIEKPPDEKERLKAAELLGKRHRLFATVAQVEVALPVIFSGEDSLDE